MSTENPPPSYAELIPPAEDSDPEDVATALETALMFATILALTIIGLVFFYAVEFLEKLAIPWHVSHRVREDAGTM